MLLCDAPFSLCATSQAVRAAMKLILPAALSVFLSLASKTLIATGEDLSRVDIDSTGSDIDSTGSNNDEPFGVGVTGQDTQPRRRRPTRGTAIARAGASMLSSGSHGQRHGDEGYTLDEFSHTPEELRRRLSDGPGWPLHGDVASDYPVRKDEVDFTTKTVSHKKQQYVIPLQNVNNVQYFGNVLIGEPPQIMKVRAIRARGKCAPFLFCPVDTCLYPTSILSIPYSTSRRYA